MTVCRVCSLGEEEGLLVAPCNCRGSAKWIHVECLCHLCLESQSYTRCDVCQLPYSGKALEDISRFRTSRNKLLVESQSPPDLQEIEALASKASQRILKLRWKRQAGGESCNNSGVAQRDADSDTTEVHVPTFLEGRVGGAAEDPNLPEKALKRWSAHAEADPKVQTIRSSIRTIGAATGNRTVVQRHFRAERRLGTEVANRRAHRLSTDALTAMGSPATASRVAGSDTPFPPQRLVPVGEDFLASASLRLRPSASAGSILDPPQMMQDKMYRSATRLMADMDFAHGDNLADASAKLRYNVVSRMHQWVGAHELKEPPAPLGPKSAYLTFRESDTTMIGSTRAAPSDRHFEPLTWSRPSQRPAWMDEGFASALDGPEGKGALARSLHRASYTRLFEPAKLN